MTDSIVFDLGELKLPSSFVTSGTTVLGQPESGKTNVCRRAAEQGLAQHVPVVVMDRKGDFWGLRLLPNGKPSGFDIPIFGGDHGDLELLETAGKVVADAIVSHRSSAILDLSNFESDAAAARFVTAFSKRLLFLKKDDAYPMLLILDEADLYAPKNVSAGTAPMVGAVLNLRKLGRKRGIGVLANAQRSSRLHQDLIDMADLLIMTQSAGRRDQATLRETLKDQMTPQELSDLLRSVSRLQKGQALAYSPAKFGLMRVVNLDKATTFDSSATPEMGTHYERMTLGKLDLGALQESIASEGVDLEKADVDDLKAEVAKLRAHRCAPSRERVEVPVLPDSVAQELREVSDQIGSLLGRFVGITDQVQAALGRIHRPSVTTPQSAPREKPVRREPTMQPGGKVEFRAGAIRMLEACAQFEERGLTRAQVAALAKIKQGPTFSTYCSELRKAGLIEDRSGRFFVTPEGVAFLPIVPPKPRNPEEIISRWRGEFRAGAVRMLDTIVGAYPSVVTRAQIADGSGILPGPTFSTYLSELKRAELIDERGGGLYAVVLDLVCAEGSAR